MAVRANNNREEANGAQRLKMQLQRNRSARDPADARNRDARLKKLQAWQATRLAADYQDISKVTKNKLACDFFLNELYSDADFAKRDQDVERIYPIMVKLLPSQVLLTVSRAVELNAMSHELDLAMLAHLPNGSIDSESYARAYRQTNQQGQRRHQLALILSLGRELARVVQIPLMYKLLQMCRWPAKLAGLGALQSFLERGFAAFVALEGARPFLHTIRTRESLFMRTCMRSS